MKPYKQPSIVGVLGALGTITFVLGVGAILVTIGKKMDHSYLIAGAGSLISGLFLAACASALDYLARGAHWAEQIATVANVKPFLAGQSNYRGV